MPTRKEAMLAFQKPNKAEAGDLRIATISTSRQCHRARSHRRVRLLEKELDQVGQWLQRCQVIYQTCRLGQRKQTIDIIRRAQLNNTLEALVVGLRALLSKVPVFFRQPVLKSLLRLLGRSWTSMLIADCRTSLIVFRQ